MVLAWSCAISSHSTCMRAEVARQIDLETDQLARAVGIVPRWVRASVPIRTLVQVWAAAAEPAPKARAAVIAMVLRVGTDVLPAFFVWRRAQSGNAWAELSSPSRAVADACAAVVAIRFLSMMHAKLRQRRR
jgi:hypothetical protein